jgi:hypothetical protein
VKAGWPVAALDPAALDPAALPLALPGVERPVRRLQPAVEPLLGQRVHPAGLLITAVVPASEPDHVHRCPVPPDGLVVRVGLVQPEQRVVLALDEQRGDVDPVRDARRAGPQQQRDRLRPWAVPAWRPAGRWRRSAAGSGRTGWPRSYWPRSYWPGSGWLRSGRPVPKPTDPWVNSRPAHCFLKTPPRGPPPAAFGNSAVARLFQVICGTMASIRWS